MIQTRKLFLLILSISLFIVLLILFFYDQLFYYAYGFMKKMSEKVFKPFQGLFFMLKQLNDKPIYNRRLK